ncbi:Ubiquitin carboxyl-terminal hydrolase 27 [Grifola frondosa]|uniref:Ubiquitin carboxyl-terminal hydrolase 27 n=1 Tax=Grifola frondosa TaxID=5627 RepID=A0A1C7M5A6_GRIFR|nr:Ubiquitin carboxyl-terminal hydrolase 27 [Grifola frondosa]
MKTRERSTRRSFAFPCQGRRGLLNLGQTCFLNVILQSFVANPLLRNYFLVISTITSCARRRIVPAARWISYLREVPLTFLTAQYPELTLCSPDLFREHSAVRPHGLRTRRVWAQPVQLRKMRQTLSCKQASEHPEAPPVLSFQFKRFEHKSGDRSAAHKIEASIRFPASLNMAQYTTLVMDAKEKEGKESGVANAVSFPYLGPEALYEYDLFSVVCHEGQIDNGHYTCFARSHDEWYRFDDDKVMHSTLGACLSSQAYMCFYVKRHLDYKPYIVPSYKVTREAEAVKEKEREREKEAARMKEVEDALLAAI